jgi:outer membrane biosynthesis protein TonB
MKKIQVQALTTAIVVYLIIISSIALALFYTPNEQKAKTFTEKKSDVIEVSLGSSLPKATKSKKNIKKREKKEKKVKKKPKKVRNIKQNKTKKVKKRVKKTKIKKEKKPTKKVNAKSLFSNVNIKKESAINNSKPKGNEGKSLKKENKSKGEENAYFAKVQNILKGWPAQNNFVGEKIKVELTIYSTGLFDYKILSRSLNPEFNKALDNYLKQLKRIGFGPHKNPKPYKIIVEFIAKD